MKKPLAAMFAGAIVLASSSTFASAQTAGGQMMSMMQCMADCSTQFMQCLASANQMASEPSEALNQIKMNVEDSMSCGTQSTACQRGCTGM